MAVHPLRPATRRRLGRPLPHQQADRPRAHLVPKKLSTTHTKVWSYPVLDPVSQAYPRVRGRSPTCYSPVRHSSTPEGAFPFDLHVLSTPPAFVLSQDQTLHKKSVKKDQPGFVKSPTKTGKKTNNQQKIILLIIHQKIMKKVKQKTVIIDALTRQHNNHPTPTHNMRVNIVCSHGIPHHNPDKSHGHETHTMFRINNSFPRHNIFTSKPHLPAKTVYTVIIT